MTDARSVPPLDRVLEYKNEDVIDGFLKSFDVSRGEAEKIFKETLKWLWLSMHSGDFTYEDVEIMGIDTPLTIIDEMWHTFILYTPAYTRFCKTYFGEYLHHQPTTKSREKRFDERLAAMTPDARIDYMRAQKRAKYGQIYDTLGHETFVTWYLEFPERYSKKRVLELRKR